MDYPVNCLQSLSTFQQKRGGGSENGKMTQENIDCVRQEHDRWVPFWHEKTKAFFPTENKLVASER